MHQVRFHSSQRSPRLPSWIQGVLLLREGREERGGGSGVGRVASGLLGWIDAPAAEYEQMTQVKLLKMWTMSLFGIG